jgi:uncharacterized protein (TIGR00369 family)
VPERQAVPEDPAARRAWFEQHAEGLLPSHLGIEVVELEPGHSRLRLDIAKHHMALNGYLHAGTVITLADTTCGYGALASLPDGAVGFTTIETKSNHLGTAVSGGVVAEGIMRHSGRTTQVWDATVTAEESGKAIALFRCTQLVLWQ